MSAYIGVKRLAIEHGEWLPIVRAALHASKKFRSYGSDEFAGSWVLDEAKKEGIGWFPNLRILARYGILKHVDTTRGGRRAYYTMPDEEEVEKALRELGHI